MQSGYFDTAQSHQNGVCAEVEEEEEQVTTAVESSEAEEPAVDTGPVQDHSLTGEIRSQSVIIPVLWGCAVGWCKNDNIWCTT